MSSKEKEVALPQWVEPERLYHVDELGKILHQKRDWVKDNLIFTDQIKVVYAGQQYWIPGWAIIEYASREAATWSEIKNRRGLKR